MVMREFDRCVKEGLCHERAVTEQMSDLKLRSLYLSEGSVKGVIMESENKFFLKTIFITSSIFWIPPAIGWFGNHDLIIEIPWWKMYGGAFYFFSMEKAEAEYNISFSDTLSYWGFWSIVFGLVVLALRRRFRFSRVIIVFAVFIWFYCGIAPLLMMRGG
jgi:hypothetical protein